MNELSNGLSRGLSSEPFREHSSDPTWSPDGSILLFSGADVGTTFKLHAVATSVRVIATRTQLAVSSEVTLTDCPPPEIIVVPGGYGARRALDDEALVSWLAEHGQRAEVLACVGYGECIVGWWQEVGFRPRQAHIESADAERRAKGRGQEARS